jgi:thioesterase domain-containing protein
LAFREVSLLLGPDHPVYGLESQLPEEGAEFATVTERAKHYIKLVRSRQPRGPYNLAGFCLGGMVAFEMAQQLTEQGSQVALLALVQANTPGFPASRFAQWKLRTQRRLFFLKVFAQFGWMRICPAFMTLPRQHRQRILDRLSKLLLGWIATSSELPDETQNANVKAMRAYRPRPYTGNVHLFLAEDCYESVGVSAALDPRRGWQGLVTGQSKVHLISGDHHSMLSGEHAHAFAEKLKSCMRENFAR